ncbi:MAG TPA: YbaK/EbsC family protein [Phycisphaerae bacterium]|nr:YbaK/EbsC family protein [Phycisphaerae bacterium]
MRLESLLELRGIPFERHVHDVTYTSQELAEAEHVSGYMIAKPVIVKGWSGYAMCVVPASKRLDLTRAADALHEPEVSLAHESELARLFPGCELGAEPPVGGLFGMKTVMDRRLEQDEFLIMQSGTHSEAIKMRRRDYEDLCNPIVAPLTRS